MGLAVNDLNTYDGKQTVYPVVNESVNVWREALTNIPNVKRAAAISSGGEISLFCFTPKVREHITLLDHSYQSMFFAIGKFHLIDKLGSKEAYRALYNNDVKLLREIFTEANKGLPTEPPAPPNKDDYAAYEDARAKWEQSWRDWSANYEKTNPKRGDSYRYDSEYRRWEAEYYRDYDQWHRDNPQPKAPPGYRGSRYRSPPGFDGWWHSAQPQYEEVTQAGIVEFRRHRNKVEFVHGDLTDLATLGPFDLVYLSNALSYSGRNGNKDYDVTKWAKPGGYVCLTYSSYSYDVGSGRIPKEAEKVFEYGRSREVYNYYRTGRYEMQARTGKTIPTRYGSQWAYGIYKLPE